MVSIQDLFQLGKDMGYDGEKLQNFVTEQQTIARDDRQREREREREREEHERTREREREEHKRERDREREAERVREHELAMVREKSAAEIERIRAAGEYGLTHEGSGKESEYFSSRAKDPKLPYFEEDKNKMDSYLA